MKKIKIKEGKYTIETFAREKNIKKQSALNLISKLRKKGHIQASGGGKQKRIYTITKLPQKKTNGFYDLVNKYSPEKLNPSFAHYVTGRYTPEMAIIDGLQIGGIRTIDATMHLFRHINNWKLLLNLAKKKGITKELYSLYNRARKKIKCKRIPRRYENDKEI